MFDHALPVETVTPVATLGAAPAGPLEGRYFDRMAQSLGHKATMLPALVPGSVLDVGAGGGELAVAARQTGADPVFALDASPDALRRLDQLPGIQPVAGFADQLPKLLRPASVNNVLCSAVLHEVFSYGSSDGRRGYDALHHTLEALATVVAPRGRLIIRDGVLPNNHTAPAVLRFTDRHRDAGLEALARYRELSPFDFAYDVRADGVYGTLHAVTEFAFTYTWGVDTFPREAREQYMVHTLAGYTDAVRSAGGLRLVHAQSVVQEGYRTNLGPKLQILVDGKPTFPATNAVWVFEKR